MEILCIKLCILDCQNSFVSKSSVYYNTCILFLAFYSGSLELEREHINSELFD